MNAPDEQCDNCRFHRDVVAWPNRLPPTTIECHVSIFGIPLNDVQQPIWPKLERTAWCGLYASQDEGGSKKGKGK